MEDCIFCKIVKGEIPSYKIYEDDKVFAFLDMKPLSEGHTLVLSKEHYVNVLDVPEDVYAHMSMAVKKIAEKIQEKYKPEGILINQNNGRGAGQEVDHIHIHIKPIYKDTEIFQEARYRKVLEEEKMEKIQKELTLD